jgi:hypothetical protein
MEDENPHVESHLIPMFLVGTTKANTEVEGLR